ncbi:MAG: hypothetical protein RR779_18110 [Comamonas sp.]
MDDAAPSWARGCHQIGMLRWHAVAFYPRWMRYKLTDNEQKRSKTNKIYLEKRKSESCCPAWAFYFLQRVRHRLPRAAAI